MNKHTTMEPPAYSESSSSSNALLENPPRSSTHHRSIQDTRELILGNANIWRPRKTTEPIELVVARHKEETSSRESHYVFLVTRNPMEKDVEILLKSKPRDTIEEALDELLARSEVLIADVLLRHGRYVHETGCCTECREGLRRT